MYIGIDNISPGLSTSRQTLGGMRHFLQSIIERLPTSLSSYDFQLFTPAWADPFDLPSVKNLTVVPCPLVPKGRNGRVLYEQFRLPRQIQAQNISLWLGTCNTLPLRLSVPSVLIVQSFQYFTQPDSYVWAQRMYLRTLVPLSIRRAQVVIAFSQASKDEIVRRVGIDPSKVEVIYHALRFSQNNMMNYDEACERAAVAQTIGDSDYILCVSAFYTYKNLARLIEAFARLKPQIKHKLVLAGAETQFVKRADLKTLATRLGIGDDLVFLGSVSSQDLPMYYRHATLMAMPSLDETFGFPVLEAMAFGCPVVTSNKSSMPEIAGDAAVLVDPYQVESIANGMGQVLINPALCARMREAGRMRAQGFTHDRFFGRLSDVFDTLTR